MYFTSPLRRAPRLAIVFLGAFGGADSQDHEGVKFCYLEAFFDLGYRVGTSVGGPPFPFTPSSLITTGFGILVVAVNVLH
jgi:hypothetical protein